MAEKLLRFKDLIEMDGDNPLTQTPLSFNDLHNTEYRPGEDELTNYRAYRRKRVGDVGSDTATYSESVEHDVDEALNMQQRLARGRQFKRLKAKIKIGRERAKRKMASKEKLETRAKKQARTFILKKLTKGVDKGELSFARRQEIEKRMEKPQVKKRINMLARRMFKDVRKKEVERKKG
tara:strand:- start:244 stop:780 length:537 start_codon:yes stop_codon:yes gene_type:complete